MNTTKILESHRKLLRDLLISLKESESIRNKSLLKLRECNITEEEIFAKYLELNNEKGSKILVSYLRAFRQWLEDENNTDLHYREAIRVICKMFDPKFKHYTYSKAVKSFGVDRLEDPINAQSEWRAYFEYRFYNAIEKFHETHTPEHWFTVNFSNYSFLEKRVLPVYRMNLGVPDRHHIKYFEDSPKSPNTERAESFDALTAVQGKYSTVWEIVRNNVSSIFYFDKTLESEKDTAIYEIDPDVLPGEGLVNAQYTGKFIADESHREKPIFEKNTEEKIDYEAIVESARFHDEREQAYQYGVMRFFIRAGIFNPRNAAYTTVLFEPRFDDKLKLAYIRLEEMRKEGIRSKSIEPLRRVYEEKLFQKLEGVQWEDLRKIIDFKNEKEENPYCQFASSKNEKKRPFQDENGYWRNFDYREKYSADEDATLNKILILFDLVDPEVINIRLSIFEAGFAYLTQKNNTISHVYWMPIIINWRNQHTGGAAFFNSDKRIILQNDSNKVYFIDEEGEINRPEIMEFTDEDGRKYYNDGSQRSYTEITPDDEVPQILISLLYYLTGIFADKINGEIEEELRPINERAAAVSIMSRNISHNIGSHVLSYLKNLLGSEHHMLKKGVLEHLVVEEGGEYKINKEIIKSDAITIDEQKLVLPYLRSLGRLLNYFQERQDYIGTFASERYLYFSPIHFKSAIVDYFSAQNKFYSAGESAEGEMRNIALDYIIFSEGYKGISDGVKNTNDIVFETYWKDQTGLYPYSSKPDVQISLPSGNTGRQGIFTILENFIRNSAKHGQPKKDRKDGKMLITITLSEKDRDFYQLEIRDNSGKTTDKVIKEIEDVLKTPLLRDDGTPDERHKGIKEIQIAAAWLRGIKPHEILDKGIIGENEIVTVKEINGDLQYTIYLRKPKPGLLIVLDDSRYYENGTLKPAFEKSLRDWDIFVYRGESRAVNVKKIAYSFVVLHEELFKGKSEEDQRIIQRNITARCPVRRLSRVTDAQLQSEQMPEDLYAMWLNRTKYNSDSLRYGIVSSDIKQPSALTIGILDSNNQNVQLGLGLEKFVIHNTHTSSSKTLEQPILFKEHNDLSKTFKEFLDENTKGLNNYYFIEGISGGNSTGRLLRDDLITHLWRYKMIEAALTKIIVIDERIWNNNLAENPEERAMTKLRWDKKNIHIFSLEYDEKNDNYLVLIDLENNVVAKIDKEGHIKFTDDKYHNAYHESHFISFHQGLLERAMKHCTTSMGDKSEADQVEQLFKQFREEAFRAQFRVLIHSGRSKTHIMPKQTAFVQLSSLGSALRDCKVSLCELFYSTIQENEEKL